VADAPVDALLARADELAGRWASVLVAARPLAEIVEVPLESLAREGPALCVQLAHALSSDTELQQLLGTVAATERGPARQSRAGEIGAWLAPAGDASRAVRDVEALRGVIWEATLGELDRPPARQVADLSDRLAFICAALLAAVFDQRMPIGAVAAPSIPGAPVGGRVLYSSQGTSPGGSRAVLIDELADAVGSPALTPVAPGGVSAATPSHEAGRTARDREPDPGGGSRSATPTARPHPWDTPLDVAGRSASTRQQPQSTRAVPDGGEADMRITRGPGVAAP
jgi:hypothetical protein